MVTEPVVTVLPTEEPETMPQRAEETTATFAGPPDCLLYTSVDAVGKAQLPQRLHDAALIEHAAVPGVFQRLLLSLIHISRSARGMIFIVLALL